MYINLLAFYFFLFSVLFVIFYLLNSTFKKSSHNWVNEGKQGNYVFQNFRVPSIQSVSPFSPHPPLTNNIELNIFSTLCGIFVSCYCWYFFNIFSNKSIIIFYVSCDANYCILFWYLAWNKLLKTVLNETLFVNKQ